MTEAARIVSAAESPRLPLDDIQGNVLHGYGFSHVAHLFPRLGPSQAPELRRLLRGLLSEPRLLTTSAPWKEKPPSTVNLALDFHALALLRPDAKDAVAKAFPAFGKGMAARAHLLGDDSTDAEWSLWAERHVWLSVHGRSEDALAVKVQAVLDLMKASGLEPGDQLRGEAAHEPDGTIRENFGFKDGLTNPVVAGDPLAKDSDIPGNGRYWRPTKATHATWFPIAPGEFLLGHPNERRKNTLEGDLSPLASLLQNGTFVVFRDLEQDVPGFREYLARCAKDHGQTEDFYAHKMMGRTRDGEPLAKPGGGAGFSYDEDPYGSRCPIGAHVRRASPRDTGERRLLRFSMPYVRTRKDASGNTKTRYGLYFVAVNASIDEQFEFVQKVWINGQAGTLRGATDPIATTQLRTGHMCIEGDVSAGRPPVILKNVPAFVTCHGGQYYFVPGVAGLARLGEENGVAR